MRPGCVLTVGAFILCTTYSWGATASSLQVRQPEVLPAGKVLTLTEAISTAMRNEPTIRQAAAEVLLRTGQVRQSRSRLLPELGVSSSTDIATNHRNTGTSLNANANQLLMDFGKSRDLLTQSEQTRASSESAFAATAFDLVFNVKQSYYTLLRSLRLVKVFQENLASQEEHVREAQARLDVGVAPKADVLKAAAAAASAKVNLVTAQNAADQAQADLNTAIGVDLRSGAQVQETAEPAGPVPSLDNAMDLAIKNRPEVVQAQRDILASQAALNASKKGNLPAFSTSVGDSTQFGGDFDSPNSVVWLMSAQWTPFDSGFTRGAITQAEAQFTQSQENLYAAKQNVSRDVVAARLDLLANDEALASARVEVASAQEDLAAATGRYQSGVGIFLEVLDAQSALLKAQVDEAVALYGLSIARAQLQRAVGATTVEGVRK